MRPIKLFVFLLIFCCLGFVHPGQASFTIKMKRAVKEDTSGGKPLSKEAKKELKAHNKPISQKQKAEAAKALGHNTSPAWRSRKSRLSFAFAIGAIILTFMAVTAGVLTYLNTAGVFLPFFGALVLAAIFVGKSAIHDDEDEKGLAIAGISIGTALLLAALGLLFL